MWSKWIANNNLESDLSQFHYELNFFVKGAKVLTDLLLVIWELMSHLHNNFLKDESP